MTTIVGLNTAPPPFPDTNSYEPAFTTPNYIDSNFTLSNSSENILSEAGIWIESCASEGSFRLGFYDMSGADASGAGGDLLWEGLITIPASDTPQFVTITPGTEIVGLPDGAPLSVAITRRISGSSIIMRRDNRNGNSFTMASASNLQDPSVTDGELNNHQLYAYVALIASGPSLTPPQSARSGSSVSFSASGLSGAITGATLSDGTSTLTLTNIVNVSGFDYTADVPAIGNNIQYTTYGNVTMSVTDGTDTATAATTLIPPDGFSLITLGATFDTSQTSYLHNFNGTPATGDQFIEGSTQLVLADDGTFVADTAGTFTIYGIDATDGIMQSFDLITGEVAEPEPEPEPEPGRPGLGAITSRLMTKRAMTRRSITSRSITNR